MIKRQQILFLVLSESRQIYEASQIIVYQNEPLLSFYVIYKRGVPYLDVNTLGTIYCLDFQYELSRFLNESYKLVLDHNDLKNKLF